MKDAGDVGWGGERMAYRQYRKVVIGEKKVLRTTTKIKKNLLKSLGKKRKKTKHSLDME